MIHYKETILGMELEVWKNESCTAEFGFGDKWATLYSIESTENNKGHALNLLREAKAYYEEQGKVVGGTVALNPIMRKLYEKLGIREYK